MLAFKDKSECEEGIEGREKKEAAAAAAGMTKVRCKICELLGESQVLNHGLSHPCHLANLHHLNHLNPELNYGPSTNMNYMNHGLLNGLYLPQLKDMMLAAYLLKGYYQPAGPLIQHPPTLPPIKGPPPESTPTPPQNSEGSDDHVAASTTSGGSSNAGGGFYRAYCPQYYGTPPQYQELCYPPTYTHPHPPPYYKYAPTFRRQYYGYQETAGGGGPGGTGAGATPGVVEYQPPPPPGEYSLPPYYGTYPPPPPLPPPPQPNPAYLHSQGRPFVDHAAFQSCPCPMQSCPKNVDTGPLIGNGKGAPVASGPGLSLPPSALVGPPSPARGRAGLAPPHGANAWDTDREQINVNGHRNHSQTQSTLPPSQNHVSRHSRLQNSECLVKDDENCVSNEKLRKCNCQKHARTSSCEVKLESISPTEKLPESAELQRSLKLENNNVKCESCSIEMTENITCVADCNVKDESDYKCEQCMKECQMAIMEMDKDSGIAIDDKIETDTEVKEELNDVVVIDEHWKKPDYESTVSETVENEDSVVTKVEDDEDEAETQNSKKQKLSIEITGSCKKKRKNNKCANPEPDVVAQNAKKKFQKRKREHSPQVPVKKTKIAASESSIMETIDDVIQQSLEMTQKSEKKVKSTKVEEEISKKVAKKPLKSVQVKLDVPSLVENPRNKVVAKHVNAKLQKTKGKGKMMLMETRTAKVVEVKSSKVERPEIQPRSFQPHLVKNPLRVVEDTGKKTVLKKLGKKFVKKPGRKSAGKEEFKVMESLSIAKRSFLKPKWSNGWNWEGEPYEAKVFLTNEESAIRRCYASMKHSTGDILRPLDCVLLRSGAKKADLPFVAKIAALWENPDDGEMMFSLLWYYRPEHTDQGRADNDSEDEVFASRHRDINSVACIEDKCYILTFNEYCRHRKILRRMEEGLESPGLIVPPGHHNYYRNSRQPPIPVAPEMVLFCRRVYDYRGRKLVKNPG